MVTGGGSADGLAWSFNCLEFGKRASPGLEAKKGRFIKGQKREVKAGMEDREYTGS